MLEILNSVEKHGIWGWEEDLNDYVLYIKEEVVMSDRHSVTVGCWFTSEGNLVKSEILSSNNLIEGKEYKTKPSPERNIYVLYHEEGIAHATRSLSEFLGVCKSTGKSLTTLGVSVWDCDGNQIVDDNALSYYESIK